MRTVQHWIDGTHTGTGQALATVLNPATDEAVATVEVATPDIVDRAV